MEKERNLKLLDLFCGAGGATTGYHLAGFDVTGVDILPQPRYPFRFYQADAIEFLAQNGADFDVIHASPPCQPYSYTRFLPNIKQRPELIPQLRDALRAVGRPYIIENVPGAPLIDPIVLCGSMFGLPLIRHRLFEIFPNILIIVPPHSCRKMRTLSHRGLSSFERGATAITVAGKNFRVCEARKAMGIDWMTAAELREAIPPAYTKFIGEAILKHLKGGCL